MEEIINRLRKEKTIEPFIIPVDPVALAIPDYFSIIKNPMDIETVEGKLRLGSYAGNEVLFFQDLDLIWNNCQLYNPKSLPINRWSVNLKKLSYKLEREYWLTNPSHFSSIREAIIGKQNLPKRRRRSNSLGRNPAGILSDGTYREPTSEERERFTRKLLRLGDSAQNSILDIITEHSPNAILQNRINSHKFILDINLLHKNIFWKIFNNPPPNQPPNQPPNDILSSPGNLSDISI